MGNAANGCRVRRGAEGTIQLLTERVYLAGLKQGKMLWRREVATTRGEPAENATDAPYGPRRR